MKRKTKSVLGAVIVVFVIVILIFVCRSFLKSSKQVPEIATATMTESTISSEDPGGTEEFVQSSEETIPMESETQSESESEVETFSSVPEVEPSIDLSTLFADDVFPTACLEYEKVFGEGNYLSKMNGMSASRGNQSLSFVGFGFPLKMKVRFIGVPSYPDFSDEETCFVSICFTENIDNPDESQIQTVPLDGEIHDLIFLLEEEPESTYYLLLNFGTAAHYMAVAKPTN